MSVVKLVVPETAGAVLDPQDPMRSARALHAACFNEGEASLLHRHRGAFWLYRDGCYRLVGDETLRRFCWEYLEGAHRIEKSKPAPFKPTRSRVLDVLSALEAVSGLDDTIEPPAWLNGTADAPAAAEFVPVANGLLHLPTGELWPSSPAFFCVNRSDVVFDDKAPQPIRWLAFLAALFGDDHQAIDALQEWFGYTLTPDTSQQKILMLVGPTRSGKGTIARVLRCLVGIDNVGSPTLSSLSSPFGAEHMIDKSLAIISDARLGGRSDQAAIAERLLSISGEDAQTLQRKFKQDWHGRLRTRFLLLTNELPRLADSSGALAKRFVVLVLKRSFYGQEDPALTNKLIEELPAILSWARWGYERLRKRGHFIQPDSSRDAIDELETLGSPVMAFVRERCHVAPGLTVAVPTLYSAWAEWCRENGRKEPGTRQTFGRDLKAAYPAIDTGQSRTGETRLRMFKGIAVI